MKHHRCSMTHLHQQFGSLRSASFCPSLVSYTRVGVLFRFLIECAEEHTHSEISFNSKWLNHFLHQSKWIIGPLYTSAIMIARLSSLQILIKSWSASVDSFLRFTGFTNALAERKAGRLGWSFWGTSSILHRISFGFGFKTMSAVRSPKTTIHSSKSW